MFKKIFWIPIVGLILLAIPWILIFSPLVYDSIFITDEERKSIGKPIDYNLPDQSINCARTGETDPSNCVINDSVTIVR